MDADWRFFERRRGEPSIDPTQGEFFASEALRSPADSLVREAIQNSLDAGVTEPVRVRFSLGTVAYSDCDPYFAQLWPHVMAAFSSAGRPHCEDRESPVPFLVIEDENTRGLVGDPAADEDSLEERNDFYYFWRNIGRSKKESTDRGRWGLGKSVFPLSSRIGAFWGLTIPENTRAPRLMGLAELCVHRVGNTTYNPYGYYGRHDGDFTLPIEDAGFCDRFQRCFGLRRSEPGLSIVIPYRIEELTGEELRRAVIRHYFYPIAANKLVVEVSEGSEQWTIDATGLTELAAHVDGLDIELPLIELAVWGTTSGEDEIERLGPPPAGRAPKWREQSFPPERLQRLRERFDLCRCIALDVGVHVHPKGQAPQPTRFRLLLQRDPHSRSRAGQYIRQGITIENANVPRPTGVRWLVVVDDPALSAFLGDTENPAHTEWQRLSQKAKGKYELTATTIDFVRFAPREVIGMLSRVDERRDPSLLRHIFSLPADERTTVPEFARKSAASREEVSLGEEVPKTLDGRGVLQLTKTASGFRLRGKLDDGSAPLRLRITAAYQVLRRDPFLRYSPADFEFGKTIELVATGATIDHTQDNLIDLTVEKDEFELQAAGFDRHRDLRVRVVLPGDDEP